MTEEEAHKLFEDIYTQLDLGPGENPTAKGKALGLVRELHSAAWMYPREKLNYAKEYIERWFSPRKWHMNDEGEFCKRQIYDGLSVAESAWVRKPGQADY
jgi:hypothetical protein